MSWYGGSSSTKLKPNNKYNATNGSNEGEVQPRPGMIALMLGITH